jgi:hypothetical protein
MSRRVGVSDEIQQLLRELYTLLTQDIKRSSPSRMSISTQSFPSLNPFSNGMLAKASGLFARHITSDFMIENRLALRMMVLMASEVSQPMVLVAV